jgi:hypothetical protein
MQTATGLVAEPDLSITVDFALRAKTSLKPVHGVTNGPLCYDGRIDLSERFREIGVPYVRLHDTDGPNSRYLVDISRIFPDFEADENDPNSYYFITTDRNIRYWEIWNEPDNCLDKVSSMWRGRTMEQVCRLYETAAVMIKAWDGSLRVGGMAFSGYNRAVCQFIEDCAARLLPLDFVSFHWYFRHPEALSAVAGQFDALLEKHGYGTAERIFDEWNYLGHETLHEELKDAQTISRFCGLFDSFRNPHKTLYGFKAYGELYRRGLKRVEAQSRCQGVYVIASRNTVLVSNYLEKSRYYDIVLKGLGRGRKKVEICMLNDELNLEHYKRNIITATKSGKPVSSKTTQCS